MTSTVRPNALLVLFVSLLGLALNPGEPASANAPRPRLRQPPGGPMHVPDVPPPAALTDNRRLDLMQRAVDPALAKLFGDLPQVLEMRLTPVRSMLDNGAKIELATGIDFTGSTLQSPTGAFWSSGKATDPSAITPTDPSLIQIRVPTEIGKVYAVDCRAREYDALSDKFSEASFALTLNGVGKTVTGVDGHVYGGMKASAATSTIAIEYRDTLARPFHAMAFWGCDVGKGG